MQLDKFKQSKQKQLDGHYSSTLKKIESIPSFDCNFSLLDTVTITGDINSNIEDEILNIANILKPWRKGPFSIFDNLIDSEWKSNIKFDIIKDHINIEGKKVADIGCNNGYYLFRMLEYKPLSLVGFDPSITTYLQFKFINKFIKSNIKYELLGVEHLLEYEEKFDTIFCLGVLYHRQDPIAMLKILRDSLENGGEIILDTLIIDGDEEICLCPKQRYQQMKNVYFLPTLITLENWLKRAGFKEIIHIETKQTTTDEQRKTEWIEGQSLNNFLDSDNKNKTIEGYPAPRRAYIKATL